MYCTTLHCKKSTERQDLPSIYSRDLLSYFLSTNTMYTKVLLMLPKLADDPCITVETTLMYTGSFILISTNYRIADQSKIQYWMTVIGWKKEQMVKFVAPGIIHYARTSVMQEELKWSQLNQLYQRKGGIMLQSQWIESAFFFVRLPWSRSSFENRSVGSSMR